MKDESPKRRFNWKKVLLFWGTIALFIIAINFWEVYGLIGFLVFFGAMILFRLWKMRDILISNLKTVEVMIFGKTLDKDQWEKGEMKNTKVQINFKGRPVTNRWMAALFFVLFFVFFIIFVVNKYTMNVIISFLCLQFAIAFKTWEVVRDVQRENTPSKE